MNLQQPESALPQINGPQPKRMPRRGFLINAAGVGLGVVAGAAADRLGLLPRFFGLSDAKTNAQISPDQLLLAEEYGRRVDRASKMVNSSLWTVMWSDAAAKGDQWNSLASRYNELLNSQLGELLKIPSELQYAGFQRFKAWPDRLVVFKEMTQLAEQKMSQSHVPLTETQMTLLRLYPYIISSAFYARPDSPEKNALMGIDFIMEQTSLIRDNYLAVSDPSSLSSSTTINSVDGLLDKAVTEGIQTALQPNLLSPVRPAYIQWIRAVNSLLDIAEGKRQSTL